MNRSRLATLAVAAFACMLPPLPAASTITAPAAARQDGADGGGVALGLTHTARATEVKLTIYRPRALHAEELQSLAGELFGDLLDVEFYRGNSLESVASVAHFMTFGANLMVRDTPQRTAEIVSLLQELEEAESVRQAQDEERARIEEERMIAADRDAQLAAERDEQAQREPLDRLEVRPRFVSLQALRDALCQFERMVASGPHGEEFPNFTEVGQANVLLIEDTTLQLERMQQLIELVDRPQPQVQVTAYVLKVAADGGSAGVPPDLVSALAGMNLGTNVRLLSTGTLRSAIQAQRYCELGNEEAGGASWKLRFLPIACDPTSGQVTLQDCGFETETAGMPTLGGNQPGATQHFQTNVTIGLDEWVVLGSVGSQPTLVALRIAFTAARKAKAN
jgi:hypothetical protein